MATQSNVPMVSEVSICNQALSWVGQHEITSLDQKHPSAQWCRNNYPFLRDAVLEKHFWTFASVKTVSTTANKDPWSRLYRHDKPLNWLVVKRAYRTVDTSDPQQVNEWYTEGDYVLADESVIYLWGVQRITDTSKFSNLFVQALAGRLAAEMAIPLAKNRLLQRDMWALYQDKLIDAGVEDGKQGRSERARARHLQRAR